MTAARSSGWSCSTSIASEAIGAPPSARSAAASAKTAAATAPAATARWASWPAAILRSTSATASRPAGSWPPAPPPPGSGTRRAPGRWPSWPAATKPTGTSTTSSSAQPTPTGPPHGRSWWPPTSSDAHQQEYLALLAGYAGARRAGPKLVYKITRRAQRLLQLAHPAEYQALYAAERA